MTILAARLVVPPERMLLATPSAPFIKETGPDDLPPCDNASFDDLSLDKLVPEPEPNLKIQPSFLYQSSIDCMSSSTESMKQAEHWGRS